MKKFVSKLVVFVLLITIIISIVVGLRLFVFSTIDWSFSNDKSVAFMGASQINRDIDVDNIEGSIQMGKPSERYAFTLFKLKYLIANNPQVKTIVLQCAPTDLWQNSDDKYFVDNEMSEFVPLFYPFFDREAWADYNGNYWRMIKFIVEHMFDSSLFFTDRYLSRIVYGRAESSLLEGRMNTSEVEPNLEVGVYGNSVNYKYLEKIISFCKENKTDLYLLYCPMYKPEYYYDQDFFYERIKQLGDVHFLDYSGMELADSLRYDAHHLNRQGAEVFTRQLCKDLNFTYNK